MPETFPLMLGFYAVGPVAFSGLTPQQRDLGGSEYAVICMAEALARRGHHVVVFTKDSDEVYGRHTHVDVNGVTYFPAERSFRGVCHSSQFDVFISSRDYTIFKSSLLNAKLHVLWNHDILSQPDSLRESLCRIDKIYCLSDYQKQQYLHQLTDSVTGKCTLQDRHISLTRNGIDLALIQDALDRHGYETGAWQDKHTSPTFMYISRPERGLLYLLRDIWPQILQRVRNAQLRVAFYSADAEQLPEQIKAIHLEVYRLLRITPQVDFLGALSRKELFQHVASSWSLIYPCVTGDTLIDCPRNLSKYPEGVPIRKMVGKSGFYTYAYSLEKKRFVLKKVKKVWKTGKRQVLKLVWFDGYHEKTGVLRATPEHKVLLYDGTWKMMKDLQPGDSLRPLRRLYTVSEPYTSILVQKGIYEDEHRFVYRSISHEDISDKHIHHEDENPINNRFRNLSSLTPSEHHRQHGGWKVTSENRAKMQKGFREYLDKMVNSLEGAERLQRLSAQSVGFWSSMTQQERDSFIANRAQKIDAKFEGASWRNRALLIELYYVRGMILDEIAEQFGCDSQTVSKWMKKFGLARRTLEEVHQNRREKLVDNHVVVSIQPDGIEDVYDMEVEGAHNFVANEIVVHNCIFPEVSCLAILESQALGAPSLTSNRGALPESNWTEQHVIFDWQKVEKGDLQHAGACADWIASFVEHYYDPGEVNERRAVAETVQECHNWATIAEEWERDFFHHFTQRSTLKAKRVVQNLIYNSDLLAAQWALNNQAMGLIGGEDYDLLLGEVDGYLTHHHEDPETYAIYCGEGGKEDIRECPGRMKVALDLIAEKFGYEQPFRVIDVGCGAGRFLFHLLKNFHNCQVLGFDFSLELCVQARKNLTDAYPSLADDISFIQHGDFLNMRLPTEDMQADCIFVGEWLEHQTELVRALTTVDSWVKEGGLVIYTTPFGPWEAITFGEAHTSEGHEIRHHVSHFEQQDLAEMFREAVHRTEAVYIQRSPIDNTTIGNYVLSYQKELCVNDRKEGLLAGFETVDPMTFYTPDYARKFLTTRPYVRIGGLMIVKNEEDNITRALKPLMRRVDHMLVYDTGSQDKTCELAQLYADEVVQGYWDDDFSAARNRALDYLAYHDVDYILWFDADEVLWHGFKFRHYINAGDLAVYEGIILLQVHLLVDAPITADIPIRLFKHKPEYRWGGKIHEHVMNSTDLTWNTNLFPLIILPDVKLLHYGYVTEEERRTKAIYRNYDLLKKDREAYPDREMGKLFLMRDYLHHVKWNHLEKGQPLRETDIALLYDVIEKYAEFAHPHSTNHILARHFYQEALQILGNAHVSGPNGSVPVHSSLLMAAKPGPLPNEEWKPEMRWFESTTDMVAYVQIQIEALAQRIDAPRHVFED